MEKCQLCDETAESLDEFEYVKCCGIFICMWCWNHHDDTWHRHEATDD